MDTRYGFCAQDNRQDYKCANCGHETIELQITNFYDHAAIKWEDRVCKNCGFKSLKPDNSKVLNMLNSINHNVDKLKPCPFCGFEFSEGNSKIWKKSNKSAAGGYSYTCRCPICNAYGPRSSIEQEAKDAWNKRA